MELRECDLRVITLACIFDYLIIKTNSALLIIVVGLVSRLLQNMRFDLDDLQAESRNIYPVNLLRGFLELE